MRLFPRKFKTWLVLTFLAGLVSLVWVFDWNYWGRDPLVQYLAEQSQRKVEIDDLRVSIDGSLEPTVHLRGVRIENAPWADTRQPLASAAAMSITFSWQSVLQWRPVISRLTLQDAEIDLEHRADGLRNWRLNDPDSRDPGILTVQSLQAERSTVRFLHQGVGLDLRLKASPAGQVETLEVQPSPALTQQIEVLGHYHGTEFSGRFQVPEVMTFLGTDQTFPLRGHLVAAQTRLSGEGRVSDLFRPRLVEAHLTLEGPDLAQLGNALSMPLAHTPSYKVSTQLGKDRLLGDYNFNELRATLGRTEVTGEVELDPAGERPMLHATLASDQLQWVDLVPPHAREAGAALRLFPTGPLSRDGWRAVDAYVELKAKAVQFGDGLPPLQGLRLTAHLDNGNLEITPLHFGLAGGQATARLSVNAQKDPLSAEGELTLRQLRIEKLLPDLPEASRISGPLNGQIRLKAQGNSPAALAASADGSAQLTLEGGQVTAMLEARLALDGGMLLKTLLSGDKPVPLRCAVATLDIRDGVGRTKQLWLETEQVQTTGVGQIDLREERFELLLAPYSKDPDLLAASKPLRFEGPLNAAPKVFIGGKPPAFTGPQGCKPLKAAGP